MALIRPFVPALDFTKSCAFYEALGFQLLYRDDTLAIYDYDGAGFLLQNFYVKDLAENYMVQFFVADLDAWWPRAIAVADQFGTPTPKAPTMQPWGIRVGFLIDPAGVLWQVAEPPEA